MTMVRIGDLRHRITIERPVRTDDDGGAATITWRAVATVWARIEDVGGEEFERSDTPTARRRVRIVMRHRADVDASMRIVGGANTYEITSTLDEEGRRQWLVCYCAVIGP